jgi:hypothetical protein
MLKLAPPTSAISEMVSSRISASCGGSSSRLSINLRLASPLPSISIVTPEEGLTTKPVSPSDVARDLSGCFNSRFAPAMHEVSQTRRG